MATDAQTAQRKKDLIAAEIAARRQAAEYSMGLLAGFDPGDPKLRDSIMPPDPTWQGTGRQEVLGDKPTILDRLIQPPVDVPVVDRQLIQDMPPLESPTRLRLPLSATQRPSLDQADYPEDQEGTQRWMRETTFDLRRQQRDRELGDYKRQQRLLREGVPLTSDAGTWTPTLDQIIQTQDIAPYRDEVVQEASPDIISDIPDPADAEIKRQGLIPRTVPVYPGAKDAGVENPSGIARSLNMSVDARQRNFNRNQQDWEQYGGPEAGSLGDSGAVTRAPAAQRQTSSEAVDVLSQINRKKNMLRAISSIWGTKDNSKSYETAALAKYGQHLTNRGLAQLTDADFESTRGFLQAATKADIPLKQILEIIRSGAVGSKDGTPKADAKQMYKDSKGDPHLGKISWVDGEIRYLTRDGKPIPKDWVLDTSPTAITTIQIGKEKPDKAIKIAMIKRSSMMMAEARDYWLDEDGRLRPELKVWDALGWHGPARTTKLKMARALSIALRLESGAAIGEDERAQFYDLFMPNATDWLTGDREAVIVDKFDDFQKYIEMIVEMIDPEWSDPDKREVFREILEKAKDERSRNKALDMD
jgi:hypothetical protein